MWFFLKKVWQEIFQKQVYLDYAATTPMDARVFSVMEKVYRTMYGNKGGMYELGVQVKSMIHKNRAEVAKILGAQKDQIIFTRGGTESNNMAILGVIRLFQKNNPEIIPHVITSSIEHDSVLELLQYLSSRKEIELTIVPCNENGLVQVSEIKESLSERTILVSIMYVNNEIGTIQPIKEIAKLLRWYKKHHKQVGDIYPVMHTDAIQAVNYLDCNVQRLGIDLLTLSGSKIYGPKSSGILYVKNKSLLEPIMFGGGQEFGLRSGTEDIAGIAGFTAALHIAHYLQEKESRRLKNLQDILITELLQDSRIQLNGDRENRIPNNINISIQGFASEWLVIQLSTKGFAVSAKSACSSDNDEESHVIRALRIVQGRQSENTQEGSLRISLGRKTTQKDMQNFLKDFWQIIK